MLSRKAIPATKMGRMSAAAIGLLLGAGIHTTPAAGADCADVTSADASLCGYDREARGGAAVPAQRTANFDEIRHRTDDLVHIYFDGAAAQPAGLTAGAIAGVRGQARALAAQYRLLAGSPGLSAPVDAPLSDPLARLHYAFGSEPGLSSDRTRQAAPEVLMRNSDALVRAKFQLTLGKKWLGFVYADMGAADSALRWQGLAGISGGHGVDLLGGWRHVTYHFTPGTGLDSLEFNGPFLGATRAW